MTNISLSSLLQSEAYDKYTEYKAHECKVLQVYDFEGIPIDESLNGPTIIPEASLNDWLHQRGPFSLPDHGPNHPFQGGLRILLQEWDDDYYATRQAVPFKDLATFQDIISALSLSSEYPYLFRHSDFVAPRILTENDPVSSATITSVVFQGPPFSATFTTLSLSYNSQTRVTSAFLGYVKSGNEGLLPSILLSRGVARHPLMLPLVCLNNFLQILRKETLWQSRERNNLALLLSRAAQASHLDSVDFPAIHERLIESHLALTNAMGHFVDVSSTIFKVNLGKTAEMLSPESRGDPYFIEKTTDLTRCIDLVDVAARDLILHRGRISMRIDVLQKVLYNHMQQRDSEINRDLAKRSAKMAKESTAIAEATRRDSSSMKAIATMFSMSIFFGVTEDSRVTTNSSFWMYWAITIPLTLGVLGTWIAWLYVEDLKKVSRGGWGIGIIRKTKFIAPSTTSPSATSPSIPMNDLGQSDTTT
ncbi:hypothetical protein VTL71DRAFT_2480 [Oculimacula yallundae]|uniref:Uncharacterized protein n=1 Tax=Oculimacula yallundae TaxID=86028 RepID=A0ABR4CB02_9HELO